MTEYRENKLSPERSERVQERRGTRVTISNQRKEQRKGQENTITGANAVRRAERKEVPNKQETKEAEFHYQRSLKRIANKHSGYRLAPKELRVVKNEQL